MSTQIDLKQNDFYSINATRFSGGKEKGLMVQFTISDGSSYHCIVLNKRDAIDFCAKVIQSLNELGESR